jgi:YcaO-like protein with predicted kinase domain
MSEPFPLFGARHTAPKGHLRESHRSKSPAETFEAISRFMPAMGITRLANITGLDSIGLPTYTAIRPNSRSLSTAQGKGLDDAAAKTSALMESIESWHAENIRLPLRFESYAKLRTEVEVVDVARVTVAARRTAHVDKPLLWAPGEDLFRHVETFVPYDLVTMNTVRPPENQATFLISTDGLAAGNHVLEAVVHGLCERIERDAAALWFASTATPRPVDLATVSDPDCRRLLRLVEDADIAATAWNITSDVGIPTYACYVMEPPGRETGRGLGFYHGFACHLNPTIALFRAIIEAVQSRVTFISGSRDDLFYENYEQVRDASHLRGMWEEIVAGQKDAEPFGSPASLAGATFEDDVRILLGALERANLHDAVAVDLSHPDVNIAVVKIIVPGLEVMPEPGLRPGERVRAVREAETKQARRR